MRCFKKRTRRKIINNCNASFRTRSMCRLFLHCFRDQQRKEHRVSSIINIVTFGAF